MRLVEVELVVDLGKSLYLVLKLTDKLISICLLCRRQLRLVVLRDGMFGVRLSGNVVFSIQRFVVENLLLVSL